MLIRQSKNSFIRFFYNKGYISNQLTRFDRIYNETGADFLKKIDRIPRFVDDILTDLEKLYGNSVSFDELSNEFYSFIKELERCKFVVTGETENELNDKDLDFSYKMENPKTMVNNYTQETKDIVDENTQNMMLEATQRQPRINGIQFELTSRCNERCVHCYIPNNKKNNGQDMSFEKVCSIIDEFAANQGLQVTLSGGEVFMHKDIMDIVRYCREKDLMITILSNLIALRDSQIAILKECNISCIQVSLYSMDAEIHDAITTVKGSFVKTKNAIEKLVAADVPVMISCPIMKQNLKSYKDVFAYARNLRCKCNTDFIMMAQSDLNTKNLENRLSLEETEYLIREIVDNDSDYRDYLISHKPISEVDMINIDRYLKMPLCGAGINDCCITSNGDIYPCAGWQDMVVGNVNEQSLMEIWDKSPQLQKIRSVTEGDFPECVGCKARDYCARCLVRNYNESNGDMYKINKHFCEVAFINKRIAEEYRSRVKEMNR